MHVNVRSEGFKDAVRLATSLVTTTTEVLLSAKKMKMENVADDEKPKSAKGKKEEKSKGKKEKKADEKSPKGKEIKGNGALIIEIAEGGTYVKVTVPAQVLTEGKLCVNSDYIKQLKVTDNIELKQDKGKVRFTNGRTSGVFEVQQDVTKMEGQRPIDTFTPKVSMPSSVLRKLVERTAMIPTMQNDTMPLRVIVKDNRIIGYCSETYRACHFDAECPSDKDFDALLPPDVLQILSQHLGSTTAIGVKGGTFQIRTPNVVCYTPTLQKDDVDDIDERVNTIRKGLKKKDPTFTPKATFSVDADTLSKSLNVASSINVGALTPSVLISLEIAATELKLSVAAAHGKMNDTLTIEDGPKKPYKVGISSKYMTEMLGLFGKTIIKVMVFESFVVMETAKRETTMVLATADL